MGSCQACVTNMFSDKEDEMPVPNTEPTPPNPNLISDKLGSKYTVSTLSDHPELLDSCATIIASAYISGPTADPVSKCARVDYDSLLYFTTKLLKHMHETNHLDMVFIVLNKHNKVVCVQVCRDLFDPSYELNEEEKQDILNHASNVLKIIDFFGILSAPGVQQMEEEYEGDLRKNNIVFHVFMAVTKEEYLGKGLTKIMGRRIHKVAKEKGYKYMVAETVSAISQHIMTKYMMAKTCNKLYFKDYFENVEEVGVVNSAFALYQTVKL